MYKILIIHSGDSKFQPMDTKKDKDNDTNKDRTAIYSKDYKTIRKRVEDNDQATLRSYRTFIKMNNY